MATNGQVDVARACGGFVLNDVEEAVTLAISRNDARPLIAIRAQDGINILRSARGVLLVATAASLQEQPELRLERIVERDDLIDRQPPPGARSAPSNAVLAHAPAWRGFACPVSNDLRRIEPPARRLLSLGNETEDIMKNALGIIGIVTLTMAGLPGEVMAQGRGPGFGGHGKRMAALNLTPQQQQQIDQFRDAAAKQSEPLRAQMGQKRAELDTLWRVDQPDKKAITEKQAELDTLRTQQHTIWTDFRFQVHAVLTPEQRSKWAELDGPGMGRGHGRWFKRGGPRGAGFGPGGMSCPNCPMQAQ